MTSEANKAHQKHPKLNKPDPGDFGRNELAILGTSCANIRKLANSIIQQLSTSFKIAFADADHKTGFAEPLIDSALQHGASAEFTDKINFRRLDFQQDFNAFQRRFFLGQQDLILINGNHFNGQNQVVVIDPAKPLEKKIDRLTNVKLLLLTGPILEIPGYIKALPHFESIPVLSLKDLPVISAFVRQFMLQRIPKLNGLVLAGGESSRMKTDKGSLNYHGTNQRQYLTGLLNNFCESTYLSCSRQQATNLESDNLIEDVFLGLGPMGGILSALQNNPNTAWLIVACDLPYLSEKTLSHLVQHRNSSKMATAFVDTGSGFPEPLITIWEPKSYPVLLQFLSQGYSCPRKVLINSDVELLQPPDMRELTNVNYPEEYQQAIRNLKPTL